MQAKQSIERRPRPGDHQGHKTLESRGCNETSILHSSEQSCEVVKL